MSDVGRRLSRPNGFNGPEGTLATDAGPSDGLAYYNYLPNRIGRKPYFHHWHRDAYGRCLCIIGELDLRSPVICAGRLSIIEWQPTPRKITIAGEERTTHFELVHEERFSQREETETLRERWRKIVADPDAFLLELVMKRL